MFTVIIVCQQIEELLLRTVKSIEGLTPQILIDISLKGEPLGVRKNQLIRQAANDWVLILDTDEIVSPQLFKELKAVIKNSPPEINGYFIPYRNYAFGSSVKYGGENFSKVRLFRKIFGNVTHRVVHEEIIIHGKIGKIREAIYHYSYRSLRQTLSKFTKYAWQVAEEKLEARELVTPAKLFLYGPHMVWARAVKDEGWRDGWRGIVIALCFGYMEALTYWMLLWRKLFG